MSEKAVNVSDDYGKINRDCCCVVIPNLEGDCYTYIG